MGILDALIVVIYSIPMVHNPSLTETPRSQKAPLLPYNYREESFLAWLEDSGRIDGDAIEQPKAAPGQEEEFDEAFYLQIDSEFDESDL